MVKEFKDEEQPETEIVKKKSELIREEVSKNSKSE